LKERGPVAVAEGRQWRVGAGIEESVGKVAGGGDGGFGGRGSGHADVCREPGKSVGVAFGLHLSDPDAEAPVVAGGVAHVPARDGVGGPGFADARLLVDEQLDAGRSEGSPIKVECAMELGMSGEARVDTGAAEKIEGEQGLREEQVPEFQRENRVGAAKAGDKMILEGPNGPFGRVAAMQVWWGDLEIDASLDNVSLESGGGFIVERLQLGFEAPGREHGENLLEGLDVVGAGATLHRFGENIVAVIIIDNE
jgi:hypothetical protein